MRGRADEDPREALLKYAKVAEGPCPIEARESAHTLSA